MHGPHADAHSNTAASQPDAGSDALTPGDACSHVQRGIRSKNGNNKGEDDKDRVVLADQHGRFYSSVGLR